MAKPIWSDQGEWDGKDKQVASIVLDIAKCWTEIHVSGLYVEITFIANEVRTFYLV